MSKQISLTELVDVNPPGSVRRLEPDEDVSFIPMQDVSESGRWLNRQERKYSSVRTGYTPFLEGDILFAKITPCMENGKGCHATDLTNGIGFGSTEFHVLRTKGKNDPRFVFQWTQTRKFRRVAERFMIGSAGQQRVQTHFFDKFTVEFISSTDQNRIAEILVALDNEIAVAESSVSKLKLLKTGLISDLLSYGLDKTATFRDCKQHPDHFQPSRLGNIPKDWAPKTIRDCLTSDPQNGIYKPESDIGRGTLLVGQTSFTENRSVNFDLARRALVTSSELSRYKLLEADLLVSRVFATVDGVGQPVLVKNIPEPAVYESNMMRLRVNRSIILPELLFHWLQTSKLRHFVRAVANSSNQTSINQTGLNSIPIAVPKMPEQELILSVIEAHDAYQKAEECRLSKLRLLKQGIADDLLNHQTPVAVLETVR